MPNFLDTFFSTPAVTAAFDDAATLRHMRSFEVALARAEGEAGAIPTQAADAIAMALDRFELPTGLALQKLFEDAAKAGTLAIPFVKLLTAAVKARDAEAGSFVHYGGTSQDLIDTALALQIADALASIEADLGRLCAAAARLSATHRDSLMLGRTLLQPAIPITFGLKAAQWLLAATDCRDRLSALKPRALVPQFGGAAGTLGSLGDKGIGVAARLVAHLPGLYAPVTPLPWHTRRGNLVALCAEIGTIAGVCGKIARDISLMMQLEVAEAFEPVEEGRGGSSALPHKRNPVRCMQTLAAASRTPHLVAQLLAALPQEHERALGPWQGEWAAIPDLVKAASGALSNMAATLEGLRVDATRMRANLDSLNGLPFAEAFSSALAPHLGRDEAHKLVERASRAVAEGQGTLPDILRRDPSVNAHLDAATLERLGDPRNALGSCGAMIDAALAHWRAT